MAFEFVLPTEEIREKMSDFLKHNDILFEAMKKDCIIPNLDIIALVCYN